MDVSIASLFMEERLPSSPITWETNHENMNELRHRNTCTISELEAAKKEHKVQEHITRTQLQCLQGLLDTTKTERDEALRLFTSLKESLMRASSSLGANGSITQSALLIRNGNNHVKHHDSSSYSLSFRNDLSTNRGALEKHPDSDMLDMDIFASKDNENWREFPEEFDILNEDGRRGDRSFVEDESLNKKKKTSFSDPPSSGSASRWETNLQRQSSVNSTAASPHVKKNHYSDGSEKAVAAAPHFMAYLPGMCANNLVQSPLMLMPEEKEKASMASYMPTYRHCSFLDMPSLVISSLPDILDNPSTPHTRFEKKNAELSFTPFSPETPTSMSMMSGSPNMASKYVPPPPMVVSPPNLSKVSTSPKLPLKRSILESLEEENRPLLVNPLPKKGKLLEAVARAGPLLQQLIVIGPLPDWKNPPPVMDIPMMPLSLSNICQPSPTCSIMPNPPPFVDTCQSTLMLGLPSYLTDLHTMQ